MSDRRLLAPPLAWFTEWQRQSGEQIPDFDAFPAIPALPDLLVCEDGTRVKSGDDWERRRAELLLQVKHWLTGTWPECPPAIIQSEILSETRMHAACCRQVLVTFGDSARSFSFDLELMIPDVPAPLPVFITQANHRRWAVLALSRGCLCCVYPGADSNDQSEQLKNLYPECDWSKLTRRAWLGCRALDYVLSLPQADAEKVCITGHSRNGKQSLIAGAMDPRFSAVISSSSGSGGAIPWRCSSEFCFQESVEFMTRNETTRHWFHPRLRFFTGREDRLPVDTHALLGLIAPRACLLSDAFNDGCGSTFGVEQAYAAAEPVYGLLGEGRRLGLTYRWGNHETDSQVIHRYIDWFDAVLTERYTPDPFPLSPRYTPGAICPDRDVTVGNTGCGYTPDRFGPGLLRDYPSPKRHAFRWHDWSGMQTTADIDTPPDVRHDRTAALHWLLGSRAPAISDPGGAYGKRAPYRFGLLGQGNSPAGVQRLSLNFGDYVAGEIFYPEGVKGPLTPVIWLHPFSHSYGYTGAYMSGPQIYHRLAQEGYLVFTYDQIGFGSRVQEGLDFSLRYPRSSLMAKMLGDVSAALDVLCRETLSCPNSARSDVLNLPERDTSRIVCLGYSLGGFVALLAAAADPRIAAVASFCGAVPLRHMPVAVTQGPMQPFWQRLQLLPKLGFFADREDELPVSLADILQLVAPRPCLLVSPKYDREISAEDAVLEADEARSAWKKTGAFSHLVPEDYNRFQGEQHDIFLKWLRTHLSD